MARGAILELAAGTGFTLAGGTLAGLGTVQGSVDNTGGRVAAGSRLGALTITGSYAQASRARLDVRGAGTRADQFFALHVGGDLALGGLLDLIPGGGFVRSAVAGDHVPFLVYGGARAGAFAAAISSPHLSGGKSFLPKYLDASNTIDSLVRNPPPPANRSVPIVSGSPRAGQFLKTTAGAWRSPARLTYSYQWQRYTRVGTSYTAISGATGTEYKAGG
jgi:hypothetical protein